MVVYYDDIPENLMNWVREQKMFWVATAPLSGNGHVNVSPKGVSGTFHLESRSCVWYQDLTGSGVETIAHITEPQNGRLTIMFVAFQGPPRILRLWGKGKVYERDTPEYNARLGPPGDPRRLPGSRSIILLEIEKTATSCGYSIPFYAYEKERTLLTDRAQKREDADTNDEQGCSKRGQKLYVVSKNHSSIDGLPGLPHVQKHPIALDTINKEGRGQPWKVQPYKFSLKSITNSPGQQTIMTSFGINAFCFIFGIIVAILFVNQSQEQPMHLVRNVTEAAREMSAGVF